MERTRSDAAQIFRERRAPLGNVATAVFKLLRGAVAPWVACLPGGVAVPYLEGLRGSGLRPVVAKTETGGGFFADGVAWETGMPALVVAITGPGLTNLITPLACARHERNPIVVLSAEVPSTAMGRRAVQDGSDLGLCSTTRLTAGITALSVAADGPLKAMSAVRHALRIAKARRMPVHVSIALDALTSPATALPTPIDCIDRGMAVDSGAVLEAVARINRCKRPAILVGRGVRPAGPELVQLAEILHCPVLTTPTAKGEFPESHPLSAGVYSFAHGRLAHQAIRASDLLIAIGCGLGEFASRNWDPCFQDKVLIHVDDDPAEFGRNFTPAVAVLGDAATTIRSLAAALGTRLRIRRHWPRQLVSVQPVAPNPTAYKRGAVDPAAAFRAIQRLLPGDARVLADIGSVSALAVHHLRINAPQRFYLPLGYACVGHAVAAAVGVRAASGKQTVVCAGDAAFLSNTELHTAVEMRLGGLVYVIANNAGNWMVESGLRQQFGRHHGIESGMFRAPANIAAIARGMGARATVARTLPELEAAFRVGLDAREPTVIDLRTQCVPPPMLDRVQFLTKARVRP